MKFHFNNVFIFINANFLIIRGDDNIYLFLFQISFLFQNLKQVEKCVQ